MKLRHALIILTCFFGLQISSCTKPLCDNTCPFANDGVCDDGGKDAVYNTCQLGTDCNDCGEREE